MSENTAIPLPSAIRDFAPEVGCILGSGLGFFAEDRLQIVDTISYAAIEGFPVSTVEGHAGRFVLGLLGEKRVVCMQGRFHFYEGYTMRDITLPIRLMKKAGVETLFVTNAAGGINPAFEAGDFMLLSDHINFLGTNPLIGPTAAGETRFPDMSTVYDASLRESLLAWGAERSLHLRSGVYLATTGPSYETPAEIRMFRSLGADAVGMSTVPEAIVAKQSGMRVVGISCITNLAAGISQTPLSHDEVAETADRVRGAFADLLEHGVCLA